MNYYNTFTIGTIDSLLQNTMKDGYCLEEPSRDKRTHWSKLTKKGVRRLNERITRDEMGRQIGTAVSPDKFLRNFLHKQAMEAVMEDFNYEHEYASPFDNGINQMLLVYRWITGQQSLTKEIVSIDKADLVKLGMDHKSIMDIKIAFDKLFPHEIVKSTYDSGTWFIKLGGRSLLVGEGPGFIKIKMQIPALEDKIKAYHNELQAELDK